MIRTQDILYKELHIFLNSLRRDAKTGKQLIKDGCREEVECASRRACL